MRSHPLATCAPLLTISSELVNRLRGGWALSLQRGISPNAAMHHRICMVKPATTREKKDTGPWVRGGYANNVEQKTCQRTVAMSRRRR